MTKNAIAAIVGGIILFVWSMVSWMGLPWHSMTMKAFTNPQEVSTVLKANAPSKGVYIMPNMGGKNMDTKVAFVYSCIDPAGIAAHSSMKKMFVFGIAIQILLAGIAIWLLSFTQGLSYSQKVIFITGMAILASFGAHLNEWNWWQFPAKYELVNISDTTIGWFLAALAIAKISKNE